MPAPTEGYPLLVKDVYPGISPEKFKGVHTGKVVLITGGATGLGFASAKAFVASGAKVFLAARRIGPLESAKAELEQLGGEVGIATVDVTQESSVNAGVEAAVKRFGKIDIVIANAGKDNDEWKNLADSDTEDWWSCVEASLKGGYLTAHATIPELVKTKGYIVFISSVLAQFRFPGGSSYNIAKHALNRLAEYVDIEYGASGVKSFSMHPGGVMTALSEKTANTVFKGMGLFDQTPELNAWTQVRLTSGSEDWMSGRFYNVTWDLDELAKNKAKIIEQDALKNRLAIPV